MAANIPPGVYEKLATERDLALSIAQTSPNKAARDAFMQMYRMKQAEIKKMFKDPNYFNQQIISNGNSNRKD